MIKRNQKVHASREQMLAFLSYSGQAMSAELAGDVERAIAAAEELARPSWVYKLFSAYGKDDNICLNGSTVKIPFKAHKDSLESINMCALGACSLGILLDQKLARDGLLDTSFSLLEDAAASALVEACANDCELEIARELQKLQELRTCQNFLQSQECEETLGHRGSREFYKTQETQETQEEVLEEAYKVQQISQESQGVCEVQVGFKVAKHSKDSQIQFGVGQNSSKSLFPGQRLSPGYADIPLDLSLSLLRALQAEKHLGITVSEAGIMLPSKSICFFVPIFSDLRASQQTRYSCEACMHQESCVFRAHNTTCYRNEN